MDAVLLNFFNQAMEQDEQDYIKKIKEDNMQLKNSLKFKEKELEQKNSDLESVIFSANWTSLS
jgi:hypothetical protein